MSEQITLSLDLGTSDAAVPLGMRISLDHTVIYENAHVTESTCVQHEMSDEDGEHELIIELFGKTHEHTVVDDAGNIVTDAVLTVTNIKIDDLDVNYLAQVQSEYHHDFNGSQSPTVDKFYGSLGCNGQVKFKFTSPFYLWLLETM
jgi:hypothetical protein